MAVRLTTVVATLPSGALEVLASLSESLWWLSSEECCDVACRLVGPLLACWLLLYEEEL